MTYKILFGFVDIDSTRLFTRRYSDDWHSGPRLPT